MAMFLLGVRDAHGEDAARAMSFVTLVLGNLGLALANRSLSVSAFRSVRRHGHNHGSIPRIDSGGSQ